MATLLKDFEQQYAAITGEITLKLSEIRFQSGSEKKSSLREVERCFEEIRELFEQMELEIRSLPSEEKTKFQTRLLNYQSQVQTLQQDLKNARIPHGESQRVALLGEEDTSSAFDDQRALLLDNTERLDRTTFQLEQGYRVALETEQIGAGVLNNLGSQREALNKTRHRLTEMEQDLGRSSRILTVMIRRVIQNRVMVIGIIALLLIIVAICIYFSLRTKK